MRSIANGLAVIVFAACTAPSPSLPASGDDGNGTDLPDRNPTTTADAGTGSTVRSDTKPKVTITLSGSGNGTIASTPGGVTCTGKTCTGSFAVGTKITLVPTPAAGSIFAGWSGACTGAGSCEPVLSADVQLAALFEPYPGTWSGTYEHKQSAGGWQFDNKGNMTVDVTDKDAGATFGSTNNATGFELRDLNGCGLVSVENGTAKDDITVNATAVTGTWNFSIPNASGKLPLPFKATITSGDAGAPTLNGTWTCAGCTGSFTLTKTK